MSNVPGIINAFVRMRMSRATIYRLRAACLTVVVFLQLLSGKGQAQSLDEVLDRVGEALDADRARLVLDEAARRAALQHDLAPAGALDQLARLVRRP